MSEEGEFKKFCKPCFVLNSSDCCNLCVKLEKVLDEARKDFPKLGLKTFPIWYLEAKTWYKKWFGSAEK